MPCWVAVVFHEPGLCGVDGVVAAHGAVVAWEPMRASLSEDDVAWDYVLLCEEDLSVHGLYVIERKES